MTDESIPPEFDDFERVNWEGIAARVDDGARLHHFLQAYRERGGTCVEISSQEVTSPSGRECTD